MDCAFIVFSALLLNLLLGGPRSLYASLGVSHYTAMPARLLRDMERKLNRDHRTPAERQQRGVIVLVVLVMAALCLGWLYTALLGHQTAHIFLLACLLPLRSSWDILSAIKKHLAANDLAAARDVLAGTVFRHHALLDAHGVARAGIELMAVQFAEKIIAPMFWYIVFGIPGVLLSRGVYLLRETVVGAGTKPQPFGDAAAIFHRVLHYIPARFAALLWPAAAVFLPNVALAGATKKLATGMADETPQALALLSAASMLSLSLGGPSSAYINDRWIGNGVAKATLADITRARLLFGFLCALVFVLLGFFI